MEIITLFIIWAIFLFAMFDDEIRELFSALIERVRDNGGTTVTRYKIDRPGEYAVYRRKINNGPWEDLTPEEWEEESEFKTFHHWRDEYAEERKQRGEGDRKYGEPV